MGINSFNRCVLHFWEGEGRCPDCTPKSLDDCTPAEWDAASRAHYANTAAQPAPVANELPAAWDLVMSDMRDRDRFGKEKYGVRLQPGNGRDFLADAYQEALDLVVYLRGAIYERDHK